MNPVPQRIEIKIQTPAPHSEVQRQVMSAFLIPWLEEMWVACGTKFGKTIGISAGLSQKAPKTPNSLWRWIAPHYRQTKIGYRYLKKMWPPEPYGFAKDGEICLTIPFQDTRIEMFHGQNADSIEGEATDGNVLDEAAKLKEEVYTSVKTTTTMTMGPIVGISTPKGKNWFHRKCMAAQEEMNRAKIEGRPPKQIFLTAPTSANPYILRESIESARRNLPDRLFRQYYLAEFIDDGAVFQFLNEAFQGAREYSYEDVWYADTHDSEQIFVGVDWAKTHDYSVFYALNNEGKTVGRKRLNRVPYPEQVAMLYSFLKTIKSRSTVQRCQVMIRHDQTGIGEVINDIINTSNPDGWQIEGQIWTNNTKEVSVSDLILSLEEKVLKLEPWQQLKTEMETFEGETTKSGRFVYGGAEGTHDDCVMSIVLANRLYRENRSLYSGIIIVNSIDEIIKKIHYTGSLDDFD